MRGAKDCEKTKLSRHGFPESVIATLEVVRELIENWVIISAPDRNFGALSFMNSSKDNYPQTPAIPDEGDWRNALDCLEEWLKSREPCGQKPHKVLRALAQETRKKIGRSEGMRRNAALRPGKLSLR